MRGIGDDLIERLREAETLVDNLATEVRSQYEARVRTALHRALRNRERVATDAERRLIEQSIRSENPPPAILGTIERRKAMLDALPDPRNVIPLPSRHDHPQTAHDAAWLARPSAASQRGMLLRHYANAEDGMTAHEAWRLLVRSHPMARNHIASARVGELADMGWLVVLRDGSGDIVTRPTDTGAQAQVYVVNPQSLDALAQWLADIS